MAWFISPGYPGLNVAVQEEKVVREDGMFVVQPATVIVFDHASYHTEDAREIAALRKDSRCVEVITRGEKKAGLTKLRTYERKWLVDQNKKIIHNLNIHTMMCEIPDEIFSYKPEEGERWIYKNYRFYLRLSDARRWNRGFIMCQYCGKEDE